MKSKKFVICYNINKLTYLLTGIVRGGFKGGTEGRAPCKKSGPLWPPKARSKVNDAGILLNYVVIASNVYM